MEPAKGEGCRVLLLVHVMSGAWSTVHAGWSSCTSVALSLAGEREESAASEGEVHPIHFPSTDPPHLQHSRSRAVSIESKKSDKNIHRSWYLTQHLPQHFPQHLPRLFIVSSSSFHRLFIISSSSLHPGNSSATPRSSQGSNILRTRLRPSHQWQRTLSRWKTGWLTQFFGSLQVAKRKRRLS